jgi:thioredoxin reductase (NADPH)
MQLRDVLIVGAGPAGLATAIAASRAGLEYLVIEKGALVNSLQAYPTDMVFFTTPELLEIGGLPFVSPHEKPTRAEALRYYRRVTETFDLRIAFDERVTSILREDGLPDADGSLAVETVSHRGVRRVLHGRTVVVATGAYDVPNLLGVPGEDLPHVTHYYKEPHTWFRKPVLVVGGKNSAAETALDLYRAGARVTLVYRRASLSDSIKYWVKPDIENRIKEGSIAALFETRVVEIRPTTVVLEREHGGRRERQEVEADGVFLMTGYRSETSVLERAGVAIDPETCGPRFNPETYETNVPGLFVAGAAVAGVQSGKIFIENGRFHGQQVIDVIARRFAPRPS